MISENEFSIGCKEALVILKNMSDQDKAKLDMNAIQMLRDNADMDYPFELIPGIPLNDQNISQAGRAIISLVYRNMFATPEEREQIRKRDLLELERLKNNGDIQ